MSGENDEIMELAGVDKELVWAITDLLEVAKGTAAESAACSIVERVARPYFWVQAHVPMSARDEGGA